MFQVIYVINKLYIYSVFSHFQSFQSYSVFSVISVIFSHRLLLYACPSCGNSNHCMYIERLTMLEELISTEIFKKNNIEQKLVLPVSCYKKIK